MPQASVFIEDLISEYGSGHGVTLSKFNADLAAFSLPVNQCDWGYSKKYIIVVST